MTKTAILGPESEPFAENCATLISRHGPYQVARDGGLISFRLKPAYRQPFSLIRTTNWLNSVSLSQFDPSPFGTFRGIANVDRLQIQPASISHIPGILARYDGVPYFERICRTIFNSSFTQLRPILSSVISPSFFGRYPQGRVLAVWGGDELHTALAVLRVIGAASDIAGRDFKQLERFGDLRMLHEAQTAGIFYVGKHMSVPVAMFLPRMYSFVAHKVLVAFTFLLDEHLEDVRIPFPRSGLEFIRSSASGLFRQDLGLSLEDITPAAIDRFALLTTSFGQEDMRSFIRQYVRNLSHFIRYILDPANFTSAQDGRWAGLAHYQAWLSFARMTDEALLMLTDDTSYLRKSALFRILDQLASLMTSNDSLQAAAFRDLLIPPQARDPISEGLALYKGAIGAHLSRLLPELRQELISVSLASIYVPGLIDAQAGTVSLRDGRRLSPSEYATSLVRELRNTEHAYYTRNFDNILAVSSGATPETLPLIGVLAYLALISRPDLFILREW